MATYSGSLGIIATRSITDFSQSVGNKAVMAGDEYAILNITWISGSGDTIQIDGNTVPQLGGATNTTIYLGPGQTLSLSASASGQFSVFGPVFVNN